jgi:hypothetical protein
MFNDSALRLKQRQDSALRLEQKQATVKFPVCSNATEIPTDPGRRECIGLVLIMLHEAWANARLHAPLSPLCADQRRSTLFHTTLHP